ncbi:MarR family winged helix-turn-helix transcriptional regulator [Pectinatus frisingensis]|uniref:MarR family winged helix-turn-helix transcriptional regulator n=1 Tax=Pectinatus frisingensis TaxID=865 RepID=UPI003D8082DD
MKKHTITISPSTRSQLGEVLLHISDDVLLSINNILKKYYITESKFALLLLLFNTSTNQSLQPSEIANIMGIRRASVTKQLIWLEKHQLIIRNICPKDKRMVNVTITKKGHQLLKLVLPGYWQTCADFTEKLTDAEVVRLLHLLIKID